MAVNVDRGENILLKRQLYQSDGITPLLIEDLVGAKVGFYFKNKLIAEYIWGTSPELRNTNTSELTAELTSAFTAACSPGPLEERWTLITTDADFVVDNSHRIEVLSITEINIT